MTKDAAERTGLAVGTPVVAGTVDCNAAWVATGAVEDGDDSIVIETAGIIGIVHKKYSFTRIKRINSYNCDIDIIKIIESSFYPIGSSTIFRSGESIKKGKN